MMTSVATLGYWDIRALAEPIRYLLKYVGVQFNDKRYEFGELTATADVETLKKNWIQEKFTLGLDFPNLPYYIDGDIKLTQSLSILRYLGRKYGLFATDINALLRQDLAEQQIQDLRNAFIRGVLFSKREFNEKKDEFIRESLPTHLEQLSKFLGHNEWLAGKLTYVDFLLYETLDWLRLFSPETVNKFDNLTQYSKRVESLEAINEYRKSGEFKDWPLFGPIVSWGWKRD